jgi:MFS family permease
MMAPINSSIRTDIPFRLDRLPWSQFHLLVVFGLGITWILDGLEVTIVGSLGPALQNSDTLNLSSSNLGAIASFYVVGAVAGALGFGWVTDRFGRRLVFYVTLIVYLSGVLLSALAWDFWSFGFFRLVTGLGIGGEYAAVNSAIDELIPAKYRGRVDLVWFGSYIFSNAWKVPATEYTRSGADGGAILPLQFCLFHIWADFSAFLSRAQ